jgi:CDP-diacylglycerol--glycerol-3-phosphate 3-phosphatidyltransferase
MIGRIWTISNLLSILRIILIIPIITIMLHDDPSNRWIIISLMIIAAFTDLLDGMLARKMNQVTEFGKIIDPIADKVAIGCICIILATQGKIPSWFFILILMRDILILAGGIYIKKIKNIILQSNTIGKWAVAVVAMFIILSLIDVSEVLWLKPLFLVASVFMLTLSFVFYSVRFLKVLNASKH